MDRPDEDATALARPALDDDDTLQPAERAALERTARRLAAGRDEGGLQEPPEELWDRIAASRDRGEPSAPAQIARSSGRGRTRRLGLALAAAAAVLVIAAVIVTRTGDSEVVAGRAELVALPGQSGRGEARLVDDDGQARLELELDGVAAPAGTYLEVWLLAADLSRLTSLGPARPDGRYVVPRGLDVDVSPVVDVSAEPPDGDPAHSGNSLVRGSLQT